MMIIGNLKMLMTANDVSNYLKQMGDIGPNVVVCPTSIYIPYFLRRKYQVGLQNIAEEDNALSTGGICARQAVSLNIKYTLVGHFDLNETNEVKNKKINEALKYNMVPILCIGETKKEKNISKVKKIIFNQLKEILNSTLVNKIIIAYEPIWAIGSNDLPSNKEIEEIALYIKESVSKLFKSDIKVIYGGSIHKENINKIREIENIDGILIGEASTNPLEFKEIIDSYFRQN